MKKILMMMVAASFAFATTSCDDEEVISANKLPQNAKTFLDTHFEGVSVSRVVKDTEGSTEYDVRLDNGFKLEFNKSGNWREVEGNGAALPESFVAELPAGLTTYLDTNHSGQVFSKVELNKSSYETETIGGLELIFNLAGDFVRYDD